MDIWQAIRVMLAKRQLSQAKLAAMVEVTRPYMCSLCNNERVPSFGLLERICEALECKVSELIAEGER